MSETAESCPVAETAAIEAVELNKSYINGTTSTPVLNGVSFRVSRGECLFLAGPSGSGKSTLLSILGCILSADSGTLNLLGETVSEYSATELTRFRRQRIGFVFQRFHLFRGLTALENVRVAYDILGWSKRLALAESQQLLESVGLADRIHHQVTSLSMGQRQRVAVARALAGRPELILADEPTASLDAESGLMAMKLLRELTHVSGQPLTLVVVTHDNRIFHLADRILHLNGGVLVG